MSQRNRKCDKPIWKTAPGPPLVCCPICSLPPSSREVVTKKFKDTDEIVSEDHQGGCSFFARCEKLKMSDDPAESARLRSEHFRKFHTPFCPTCRRPVGDCRRLKLGRVKTRLKRKQKDVGDFPLFGGGEASHSLRSTPEELRRLADSEKCEPPDTSKYSPITPDWYTS